MRNREAFLCLLVPSLFSWSVCHLDSIRTTQIVGSTECSDCAENNIKISHAVSGLRVTVECKAESGHFKTRGSTELDDEGKFRVALPDEIVKDGKLTEECFAQLHSASLAPCPARDGLEASKIIVLSSEEDGKTTFGLAKKMKFSPEICSSDFLYKHPPVTKLPPLPKYPWHKKPLPKLKFPPLKGFGHPFVFPPLPPKVFPPKFLPPPFPIYKKPLPPPFPIYKKPLPPPIPIYKKPRPPPIPKIKKPPVPIYKPKPPIFKPHPFPKILPPPFPFYKKPLPPLSKLPPFFNKPCPPFPKPSLPKLPPLPTIPPEFYKHPKFGKFPPFPPFHLPHFP